MFKVFLFILWNIMSSDSNSEVMNGFIVLRYSLTCCAVNDLHFVAVQCEAPIHWLCILLLRDKSAEREFKEHALTYCVFKTNILSDSWQQTKTNGTSGYLIDFSCWLWARSWMENTPLYFPWLLAAVSDSTGSSLCELSGWSHRHKIFCLTVVPADRESQLYHN